ncbi:MAG: hypothetical protein AVDCRST_MAG68-1535 [uncultured Gemmatimonadetes bacterium]|uniref:Uncharacterized protein n=1 Tax=uncultured Gemmatimonadota bacterium TaxID=203437 RepID=A0A6J4KRW3_9BACT|nr:MAG: hypothetical protein AVDCRST_MAG68-1535 [uncultured Gemmatimonadota bacterium]
MDSLDRTVMKIGTLALVICAVGLLGVENPRVGKSGPAPLHLTLRRPPPCVPAGAPAPVAALRGDPDRIVPVPSPCAEPVSGEDAAAALRRLRADLARIQVLREAAAGK